MQASLTSLSLLLADSHFVTISISIATGIVGVATTVALLKWRADKTEEKDKEQDKEHKEMSRALTELTATVRAQTSEVKNEIHESEARTDEKLQTLTKTLSRKIEGLREVQAKQGTALAVIENDQRHMNDRVDSHDRQLSALGKTKGPEDG